MKPSHPVSSELQLRLLVLKLDSIVSFPGLAVMLLYLATLVEISAREWQGLGLAGSIYAAACTFALEPVRRHMQAPVRRFLRQAGGEPDLPTVRAAFAGVMRLPREMMRLTFVMWVVAGPLLCFLMYAFGFEDWIRGDRLMGMSMVSLTGGLTTMSFTFFAAKRGLAPIRTAIAARLPDASERQSLVETVSLASKLRYVVAGTGVASLLFTMSIAYEGARDALVQVASSQHERALDALAHPLAAQSLDEASASLWPDPLLMPEGVEFALHAADALPVPIADRARSRDTGSRMSAAALISWRRLVDGRVLTASTDAATLLRPVTAMRAFLAMVLVIAAALCLAISWLLARDARESIDALRRNADRVASGDLRPAEPVESDDELGELARAFEQMGGGLRATVERVAAAAERLESAVAEIGTVGSDVASSCADQNRRVAEAGSLMASIRGETAGVAKSAHSLGELVEESSSSILELGATGDELSDTAGVLSARIDEVSGSIEQIVRSVKQVGVTTQGVAEAASETSSSMEEMASAMRAIDTTATKTATLAADVVESSESGLAKVRETIDGMQSIRDATDAAEHVVRGLGKRTEEIGAILDVIDDVGDETTLLALNAAIIAAQAGEQGRAFSVVADEIKELADRVLSSTKEIGGLIRAVQAEAGNAVGAIEAGSLRVSEGVDLAAEAGVSLEGITRAAAESGQHIERIVEAVREQTGAASHVAELMDRVSGGVDEIRAVGSEQDRANEVVFRSASTMREIAQQVRRTTEEQSRGFTRIRESVEGVRESVEQIDGSLQQQSAASEQVGGFLEMVNENTSSNEQSVRRMHQAMEGLAREAEALREEVGRFRV